MGIHHVGILIPESQIERRPVARHLELTGDAIWGRVGEPHDPRGLEALGTKGVGVAAQARHAIPGTEIVAPTAAGKEKKHQDHEEVHRGNSATPPRDAVSLLVASMDGQAQAYLPNVRITIRGFCCAAVPVRGEANGRQAIPFGLYPGVIPTIEFFLGHMEVIKRVRNLYSHMFPCITKQDCTLAKREILTLGTHINSRLQKYPS
jgi:hypothetical protein